MTLTRRDLLKGLFGGAALAVTPVGLLVPEEPQERVRRYWQVGVQLSEPQVGHPWEQLIGRTQRTGQLPPGNYTFMMDEAHHTREGVRIGGRVFEAKPSGEGNLVVEVGEKLHEDVADLVTNPWKNTVMPPMMMASLYFMLPLLGEAAEKAEGDATPVPEAK